MIGNKKVGLALSGGGYRAAAFHLGTLEKLHEMGVLEKVDIISTVSGGSIVGAYYCYCLAKKRSFDEFKEKMYQRLRRNLELRTFINRRSILVFLLILLVSILVGINHTYLTGIFTFIFALIFVFFIRPKIFYFNFTEIKAYWYDKFYYHNAVIGDLPDKPLLVINATNIETGKMWIFTKTTMGDYTYTYQQLPKFNSKKFRLSHAVASSSAVPGIFEPIRIKKKFFLNIEDTKKHKPALSDGAIYDDQGIHKLAQKNSRYKCNYIICSDAAAPLKKKKIFLFNISVLKRARDVMMSRIKNLQYTRIVHDKQKYDIDQIAYYSFTWSVDNSVEILRKYPDKIQELGLAQDYERYKKGDIDFESLKDKVFESLKVSNNFKADLLSKPEIEKITKIATRLRAVSEEDQNLLRRQGRSLTEFQVRLWCSDLVKKAEKKR